MKKLITLLLLMLLTGSAVFAFTKKHNKEILDIVPLMNSVSQSQNRVWAGTFALAWNDLMDGIVKGPVEFVDYNSKLANELNKQKFKADYLSPDSYYKTYGEISPELKTQIENAIKEKFNETSDVLNGLDWTPGPNKYLVYAMLKKDFKFLTAFDKLKPQRFGKDRRLVSYFGINEKSDEILDKTISVLFYNSSKDFAIVIRTDGSDMLYLYRTNDDKTFDRLYSDMFIKKAKYDGLEQFQPKDEFKVPEISISTQKSFNELSNKVIKNTDGMMIDSAIETIQFNMNNEGVKLKSEAVIATKMSALIMPDAVKPRKFYFDDTFVMFLQESGKPKPYFALRVKNRSGLQ